MIIMIITTLNFDDSDDMMIIITMVEMNYVGDIIILGGKEYQMIMMKKNCFVSITT